MSVPKNNSEKKEVWGKVKVGKKEMIAQSVPGDQTLA